MHSSTISHSVSSNDENYDGAAIDNVTAHIADDDRVGVAVTPGDIQVAEGGVPQSYQIVLASRPTDAVTISIATDGQITVHPTLLTFAELKWNVPQTVTVTAVDDDVAEGLHPSTISHIGKSGDRGYLDVAIRDVAAQVTDNDAASAVLTATQGITESRSVEFDFGELGSQLTEVFGSIAEQPIRINPLFILLVLVVVVVVIVQLVFGRRRR
jgi:hypothetical protein